MKTFNFIFQHPVHHVTFLVNEDILTEDKILNYLHNSKLHYFEGERTPLEIILRLHAIEIFHLSSYCHHHGRMLNQISIIKLFNNKADFLNIDGSDGITLINLHNFQFSESQLELEIKDLKK